MAYEGFKKLKGELAYEKGVYNPGGLAAYIGRRKYGAAKVAQYASEGKTMRGVKVKRPKT
jgi:hypothetical protein